MSLDIILINMISNKIILWQPKMINHHIFKKRFSSLNIDKRSIQRKIMIEEILD